MRQHQKGKRSIAALVAWAAAIFTSAAAAAPQPIILEPRTFPESVTSTRDGTLLIGSTEKGGVYRVVRGVGPVEMWVQADSTNGIGTVFGVLADEAAGLLWLCSNDLARAGKPPSIKAFDLKTGAYRTSHELPGGGMCNDMAVDRAGTLYATDMGGRILRMTKGAARLEPWISDPVLRTADGIVVTRDGRVLVNTFGSGKLYAVRPARDGAAGPLAEIRPSRPLAQPDGMRLGPDGSIYLVEGAGKADRLVLSGDTAQVTTLAEGLDGPAGITLIGRTPWVVEGKAAYRMNPTLRDKDPGAFRIIPIAGAAK